MLSLILGFVSSLVPALLGAFKDASDKKHELELLKARSEYDLKTAQITTQRDVMVGNQNIELAEIELQESTVKADALVTSKASQWVINVNSLIRPSMAVVAMVSVLFAVFNPTVAVPMLVTEFTFWVAGYFLGQRCLNKR